MQRQNGDPERFLNLSRIHSRHKLNLAAQIRVAPRAATKVKIQSTNSKFARSRCRVSQTVTTCRDERVRLSATRAAAAAALQAATVNIAQAISVHEFPGVQVAKEIKVDSMNPPPLVPVVPVAMPLTTCFANQVCHPPPL